MNPSELTTAVMDARLDDARRQAAGWSRAHGARRREPDAVVIRAAGPADAGSLARVAALDSARPPRGDVLLAEAGGRIVAAIGVADGHVVADPFVPTADVVRLLELRAAQVRESTAAGGPALVTTLARRTA